MKCLHLPLCPPNHRKDITRPITTEATVEDWLEYGQEFTSALDVLSTWMQEEINRLKIYCHGATAATVKQVQEQNSLSSVAPSNSNFQFQLIRSNNDPAAATATTSMNGGLNTNPCMMPVATKDWWYQSRSTLRALLPVIEEEEEEEEEEPYNDPMDEIRPPPEDLPPSRSQRYNSWSQQYVPPSVRIEEIFSSLSEDEADHHPIETVSHQESLVHYDIYLRFIDNVYGNEGKMNMLLLNYLVSMLNLYYIDHVTVGGKKWQDVWTHHGNSHMSFQGMMFLAIMQARILRQLFCELYDPHVPQGTPIRALSIHGLAYKRLYTGMPEFKWATDRNLVIGRSFPIAIYTQSEIEQTLGTIMFKTGRVEWDPTLHHLIHTISDRLACFFYQSLPLSIMNVEGYRKPLSDKLVAALTATERGDISMLPTGSLFVYNFDFLYRCSWRYYYLMQNIMGFEQFICSLASMKVQDIPHKNRYSRQEVIHLANILKQNLAQVYGRYTRGEKNTINEHMRKAVVGFVLPQGDMEWTRYKYPIYALNPNNIMEKLHGTLYTATKAEIFPVSDSKVIDVYFRDFAADTHPLHFIHNYLVLYLFDKHLVQDLRNMRFLATYVIPQQNIHFFAKLLFNSHEPYIRQWMGRYYVCYNNTISFCNTDIYQVMAEWILIAFNFCPELWELIQIFGEHLLPPYLLAQNNRSYEIDIQHTIDPDSQPPPPQQQRTPIQFEQSESDNKKNNMLLIL